MPWTRFARGALLCALALIALASAQGVGAKDRILTFQKIVILEGGANTQSVGITDKVDLAGTALDSIRPNQPPQDDLGTPYRLVLYPHNSDVPIEVAYYASRSGNRGYIHQEEAVSLGGGTLHAGWNQPTPAMEATLRKYGAINLTSNSGGLRFEIWQAITILVGVAMLALVAITLAWRRRKVRRPAKAV